VVLDHEVVNAGIGPAADDDGSRGHPRELQGQVPSGEGVQGVWQNIAERIQTKQAHLRWVFVASAGTGAQAQQNGHQNSTHEGTHGGPQNPTVATMPLLAPLIMGESVTRSSSPWPCPVRLPPTPRPMAMPMARPATASENQHSRASS